MAPRMRRYETSGLTPYSTSYGVRPHSALDGVRLWTYVAVLNASAQRYFGMPESWSIARTALVRTAVVRSETPLDSGLYRTVVWSSIPSRSQNSRISRISPMHNSRHEFVQPQLFRDSFSAAGLLHRHRSSYVDVKSSQILVHLVTPLCGK